MNQRRNIMKEYLKHNILNVEIQREDEKRLHVSPLFYGAYNNALNGTLIYSEEGLTIPVSYTHLTLPTNSRV